jgi:hypothetical protein
MTFSDETLMAYVDDELDGATRAALQEAMAGDPRLAQRVARHRKLRARLSAAFDPVLEEPLPERLLAAARGTSAGSRPDNVIALARARPAAPRWSWPQWGAIAASLIAGVLLSPLLLRQPAGGALVARDGQLVAGGVLEHALSEQLASSQTPEAPVRIGVSFRAKGGDYCRTFVLRDNGALAGLACRDHGAWRLQVLAAAQSPAGAPGAYRPAAALPAPVMRAVDELIAGEPLDANAEAAARSRRWSR